jgi:DNA-binding CsgD family transcriptional regulator
VAIARELGAKQIICDAHIRLGWMAHAQGDYRLAFAQLSDALAIAYELEDKSEIGSLLIFLGNVAYDEHDYAGAQALYEESLALFQELGAEWSIADALHYMGQLVLAQGDDARAAALFRESLTSWRAIGTLQWKGIAECLDGLAGVCVGRRQFEAAARLFGAAEASREFLGAAPLPLSRTSAEDKFATLHVQLDEAAFVAAWAEGRTLSPEQAIDYALALPDMPASVPAPMLPPPVVYPAGLTPREVEVLRLLARGLTYVQIAEELIISRRTVNTHVISIYSKLGVNGRAAATRFAVEHQLV